MQGKIVQRGIDRAHVSGRQTSQHVEVDKCQLKENPLSTNMTLPAISAAKNSQNYHHRIAQRASRSFAWLLICWSSCRIDDEHGQRESVTTRPTVIAGRRGLPALLQSFSMATVVPDVTGSTQTPPTLRRVEGDLFVLLLCAHVDEFLVGRHIDVWFAPLDSIQAKSPPSRTPRYAGAQSLNTSCRRSSLQYPGRGCSSSM